MRRHVAFTKPHDLQPGDLVIICDENYTVIEVPGSEDLYAIPRRWHHGIQFDWIAEQIWRLALATVLVTLLLVGLRVLLSLK